MTTDTAPPSPPPLLEACVTSAEEARAAVEGGAHRLELCVSLELGGLTPPVTLLRAVKARVRAPVYCMVRPRAGSFVATSAEVRTMEAEVDALAEAGADGLVLGLLREGGRPAVEAVSRLVERAGGIPVTFHRAFDEAADPLSAVVELAGAGVARVLTGGGPGAAIDRAEALRGLVAHAHGRIGVVGAGTVRGDHARRLVAETGLRELHARASAFPALAAAFAH